MNFISNLIDRRRVWRSLPDYPVYAPPFHDAEAVLSKKEIAANYRYFLAHKTLRLEYLAGYLRRFSVELRLTREALPALDLWLHRHGGHLIPSLDDVITAMQDYEPAWSHEYHGLNIIHDISIFAGDYVISKNSNVNWDVYYGDGTKRDYEEMGFGQAGLVGLPHFGYQGHYSMFFHEAYQFCYAGHWRLREGGKATKTEFDIPGEFVRRLDYLANPNPPLPVPFSQLTIDD